LVNQYTEDIKKALTLHFTNINNGLELLEML